MITCIIDIKLACRTAQATYSVVIPGHSQEFTSTGTNLRSASEQSMLPLDTLQTQSKGHSQPERSCAAVSGDQRLNRTKMLICILFLYSMFLLADTTITSL